jgi:hypothetical protein
LLDQAFMDIPARLNPTLLTCQTNTAKLFWGDLAQLMESSRAPKILLAMLFDGRGISRSNDDDCDLIIAALGAGNLATAKSLVPGGVRDNDQHLGSIRVLS